MHGWTLGKVRSFARLSSLGQASDSDSNSDLDLDSDLIIRIWSFACFSLSPRSKHQDSDVFDINDKR